MDKNYKVIMTVKLTYATKPTTIITITMTRTITTTTTTATTIIIIT